MLTDEELQIALETLHPDSKFYTKTMTFGEDRKEAIKHWELLVKELQRRKWKILRTVIKQ